MPSPFPGMDPYLESPSIWPDVHHELISEIRAALNPQLRPNYVARVELRVDISDDDDPGREAFLKIIHLESQTLITVIEILSPSNKILGSRGRTSFMAKRNEILNTEVHLVELDLLRSGTPIVTNPALPPSDYRILISRGDQRTLTRLWPVSVRQSLPIILIPLRRKDPELPLDLGAVFTRVYERAAYDVSLDYEKAPQPPLQGDDAKWAKELVCKRL